MKSFKVFRKKLLGEGFLDAAEKAHIDDHWSLNASKNKFSDHAFGGSHEDGHHTIRIPLQEDDKAVKEPHPSVKGHLESKGWDVHDYGKGLAHHPESGRVMKIGKVLNQTDAPDEVKKQFATDPARTGSRGDYEVHISRHPHDVGRASVNQHWSTCLDVDKCGKEVAHGSHVAYLAKKDDPEAEHPRSRVLLKKFTNVHDPEDHVLRPEMPYGNPTPGFHKTVQNWTEKHFPFKENAHYEKHPKVYNDNDSKIYGDWSEPKNPNYRDVKLHDEDKFHANMSKRHDISHEKLTDYLNHDSTFVRANATGNPRMKDEHFDHVLSNEKDYTVKTLAMMNPKAKDHHMSQYLTDKSVPDSEKSDMIRAKAHTFKQEHWDSVANHGGEMSVLTMAGNAPFESMNHIKSHHISRMLDRFQGDHGFHPNIVRQLLSHPEATDDHRIKALDNSKSHHYTDAVIGHKNTKSEKVFDHFFNHTAKNNRVASETMAYKNPHIPDKYMESAKTHDNDMVRAAAAELSSSHPWHDEHLHDFLSDKDPWVRASALSGHENVRKEHIDKAITDESPTVREMAVDHPRSERSHHEFVVHNDPDESVRDQAHARLKWG